jgi:hypothetical protein
MSTDRMEPNTSHTSAAGKGGSTTLDRDAKRAEDITQAKDRDRDDDRAELARAEATKRVEQDAAVETIKRQAKEAGSGSGDAAERVNQDG